MGAHPSGTWVAVADRVTRCVQLLISDERTDPNIKDDTRGNSPLMQAVKRNFVELLLTDPRFDLMTSNNYKRSEKWGGSGQVT